MPLTCPLNVVLRSYLRVLGMIYRHKNDSRAQVSDFSDCKNWNMPVSLEALTATLAVSNTLD